MKDWLKINFNYLMKNSVFLVKLYLTNKYENIVVVSTYGKECLITLPGSDKRKYSYLWVNLIKARAGEKD